MSDRVSELEGTVPAAQSKSEIEDLARFLDTRVRTSIQTSWLHISSFCPLLLHLLHIQYGHWVGTVSHSTCAIPVHFGLFFQ